MATSQIWRRSSSFSTMTLTACVAAHHLTSSTNHETPKNTSSCETTSSSSSSNPKLLFLGTGSSTGCPKPLCTLLFPPTRTTTSTLQNEISRARCATSILATRGNPLHNKNYRNNPSLLITHDNNHDDDDDDGTLKTVVIDVGKTFREGAIRWMPRTPGVTSLDAIVLTHEHMDAVGGLDDVRGFQRVPKLIGGGGGASSSGGGGGTPVYLSRQCFDAVKKQFHYLVPRPAPPSRREDGTGAGGGGVVRKVASLEYHVFRPFVAFSAAGLKMIPLPVMHGEDFVSFGFAFTLRRRRKRRRCRGGDGGSDDGDDSKGDLNVVYLSDISRMLPETQRFILEELPETDLLVVDALMMENSHPVHFSLAEAISLARVLRPKKTLIVGINCDDFPEHDVMNAKLKELDIDVQLAHDGLVLEVS